MTSMDLEKQKPQSPVGYKSFASCAYACGILKTHLNFQTNKHGICMRAVRLGRVLDAFTEKP